MHIHAFHHNMSSANRACVEQDNPTKFLILLPGDITPKVMHEYTNACAGYFEQKEIPEDNQVCKILAGLRDIRIKDWFTVHCLCLQELTFDNLITGFRENYLDEDWEDATCHELLNISQGTQNFWDFVVKLQAKGFNGLTS
jgi:hypothetical protein